MSLDTRRQDLNRKHLGIARKNPRTDPDAGVGAFLIADQASFNLHTYDEKIKRHNCVTHAGRFDPLREVGIW